MKNHRFGWALLLWVLCASANATSLLVNGGFETGTFAGWTLASQAGSFPGSGFYVLPATTLPQSGQSTVGPASGLFYAVSDGAGSGAHALIQVFTVAGPASSVVLSFSLFVNSYGGNIVNPIGLDFTDGANQHARVDILAAGASAFDTGAGVLQSFYLGTDAGANPHAYTNYTFDITSLVGAGGTFQLRFAEVDNQLFLNMGVDNAHIEAQLGNAVPEPSSILLSALGLIILIRSRLRRG
jgi:PEP-CTERM motif